MWMGPGVTHMKVPKVQHTCYAKSLGLVRDKYLCAKTSREFDSTREEAESQNWLLTDHALNTYATSAGSGNSQTRVEPTATSGKWLPLAS